MLLQQVGAGCLEHAALCYEQVADMYMAYFCMGLYFVIRLHFVGVQCMLTPTQAAYSLNVRWLCHACLLQPIAWSQPLIPTHLPLSMTYLLNIGTALSPYLTALQFR